MYGYQIPATTANLAVGFDTFGMALDLYNKIYMEEIDSKLIIEVEGVDKHLVEKDENNLAYKVAKYFFDKVKYPIKGLHIKLENNVPVSRGLGSSATIILGSLFLANQIAKAGYDKERLLLLAKQIECHTDNLASALYGGFVVSKYCEKEKKIFHKKIEIDSTLKCITMIPDYKISTAESRNILPKSYSQEDTVQNISSAALMALYLKDGDYSMLKHFMQDNIHEPYRKTLIKEYDLFKSTMEDVALCSFISGSGSTMIALCHEKDSQKIYNKLKDNLTEKNYKCDIKILNINNHGIQKIN